ncbi:MAG TPA: hypothetical protein VEH84_01255 [Alphaproteobacteria bacterium]|nr:hypothetical protein [Alphaproteobacteria bacterium]
MPIRHAIPPAAIALAALLLAACQQPGAQMARLVERQGGITAPAFEDAELAAVDEAFRATVAAPPAEDAAVAARIVAERDRLEPPYFYEAARRLLATDPNAALEWFAFGQLRARYDALRCADESAGDFVFALPQIAPEVTRTAEANLPAYGAAGLRALARPELFVGTASPWWICARSRSAAERVAKGEPARASVWLKPEDEWPSIRQALRDLMGESYRRLAGAPPAPTPSPAPPAPAEAGPAPDAAPAPAEAPAAS